MRYSSAVAFRTALEARLLEQSRTTGLSLARLRKSVVFARFLARLLHVAPDAWVLKGGLALDYRLGSKVRTTRDMDLAQVGSADAATEQLIEAQQVDLGDFLTFEVERTADLDEMDDGSAVRYHLKCSLAGRIFEECVIDVGFDIPAGWDPDVTQSPDLLDFAGIEPVDAPTLAVELHVAEKVHAYTRTYGEMHSPSSRVKDLIDIALIATHMTLNAATLLRALRDTFAHRRSHELPSRLPEPPGSWRSPYSRLADDVGVPRDLGDGFELAARMLDPLLSGEQSSGRWNPGRREWTMA
jgi:hypothetical protein